MNIFKRFTVFYPFNQIRARFFNIQDKFEVKALFWKWWSLLHSHFNHHYLILPYTIHTYIRVRISMKSSWKKIYTRNHLPSIFKGEGRTWDIVVLDIRFLLQWSNNLPNIKIHQTNLQKEDWRRYLTAKNDNFPQEITYTYIYSLPCCVGQWF